MPILEIIVLIWIHFTGDFVLQFNKMAMNKGSSLQWLTLHVTAYSMPLVFFALCFAPSITVGVGFVVLNFLLHWLTDFVTSKVSGHFNKIGNQRMFFATIGFDQAIHMTCLYATYMLLWVGV